MARAATARALPAAAKIDASSYSFEELIEVRKVVNAHIEARKAQEIEALRLKVQASAGSLGISVEELFGFDKAKRQTKHPRGKQPAKYRGPNGEEWSGRGPSPRWMKPLLAKGKKKEDFLIKQ